jgi:hypothetical protein
MASNSVRDYVACGACGQLHHRHAPCPCRRPLILPQEPHAPWWVRLSAGLVLAVGVAGSVWALWGGR